jgi:PKHD-type hydroxylase
VVQDLAGESRIKFPAGDMVLYSGTSVHRVEPVSRGVRLASFFWIQSMVREDAKRDLLFQLDTGLQQLGRDAPDHAAVVRLMGVYHNLLRLWSDT